MRDIFVSIVGCDEDFIYQTVQSAIENSFKPDRLHFGIVEQRGDELFYDFSNFKNLKHKKIFSNIPIGVGDARSKCIKMHDSQEFILITDAHMVFKKGWDENLIRRYDYIERSKSDSFVISQHLPTSAIENDALTPKEEGAPSSLYFDGLFIKDRATLNEYEKQYPVTCQFIFGKSKSVLAANPDPRVYYLGEESLLSLLYFLNRVEVFSIDYNPMYHLVKQNVSMGNDWRKKSDPGRMAKDFEILYKVFYEKRSLPRSLEYNRIVDDFKKKSGLDISCVFKNLGIELDDSNKLEKVKKIIVEELSSNDFDTSIFSIIANKASINGV